MKKFKPMPSPTGENDGLPDKRYGRTRQTAWVFDVVSTVENPIVPANRAVILAFGVQASSDRGFVPDLESSERPSSFPDEGCEGPLGEPGQHGCETDMMLGVEPTFCRTPRASFFAREISAEIRARNGILSRSRRFRSRNASARTWIIIE